MAHGLEDKKRFAEWLETPNSVRVANKMPKTRAEYARKSKIPDRTLRRWGNEDEETADLRLLARRKWDLVGPDTPAEDVPELPFEGTGDDDEAEHAYDTLRSNLQEQALAGDQKSMDMYWRYFGKQIEARRQALSDRGLSDLTDDDLVDRTLTLVGRERILEWLNA